MTAPSAPRKLSILREGTSQYLAVDPDGFRAHIRDNKQRALKSRLMTAKEAVERFVSDGDYLTYECNYLMRGPNEVVHEIIRQGKKRLWAAGKFTYVDVALLVDAGCVSRADCGFFLSAPPIDRALKEGRLEVFEYSNVIMTLRLQAGAMGVPFLPVRSFGGTDGFDHSGAKLITDPYTGDPITIVPALNPDVAVIHAHQADVYGNARIFGTGVSDVESALASKKVIISAEEIVETAEIRRNPGATSIPYYAVDAVVHSPYGSYPGTCPGYYGSDPEGVFEVFRAIMSDQVQPYLDKWVRPFETFEQMLDERVGKPKLEAMRARETAREGYSA
ncbi:MAG: CoA transferase subunit A [Dehalococcoidia bacterium]|uniref:CoA transferase subunit A n=1 Tax=Candidatus Amarobacter glycogenicus TaxID=3140699 RepID=UPI001D47A332|nr:CoA transferase subunit A [Dehalococcoidia bacterium]MBK7126923.1 CoA transferase subunit A [Dehalococcoidia bacterium]MBK7724521.1 CoA transferase subunit A [Dehalococcoidia bacterium]MBK8558647.1 CoA transferase subunit A [Dehalococcoidia bacterium]MBK9546830.1 CoA transferase subunit A [Dehalococcoidia bacterium]